LGFSSYAKLFLIISSIVYESIFLLTPNEWSFGKSEDCLIP